jgi:hypothetical protein
MEPADKPFILTHQQVLLLLLLLLPLLMLMLLTMIVILPSRLMWLAPALFSHFKNAKKF